MAKKIFISVILFLAIFSVSGFSDSIIKKESYTIGPRRVIKTNLNVLMTPFNGQVRKERTYILHLVSRVLSDTILSFKRVRIPGSIVRFERKPFPVGEEENISPRSTSLLTLRVFEGSLAVVTEDILTADITSHGQEVDVVIQGTLHQDGEKLAADLAVYNRLYGTVTRIQREGSFRDLNGFLNILGGEIMKSLFHEYGFLTVETNPPEALLYVDDRYWGRSGRQVIVEAGEHEVRIRKDGFQEEKITVSLPANERRTMSVVLKEERTSIKKTIRVATVPDKARVYLDSNFIGYSPMQLTFHRKGMHRIRIAKKGYVTSYESINPDDLTSSEIEFQLKEGNDREYYFSRTTAYRSLFRISLIGSAGGLLSWFYYALKIEDERSAVRRFEFEDPNNPTQEEVYAYQRAKDRRDDRIQRYRIYQNISIAAAVTLIVSAGIFYYLDLKQDDIEIAFWYSPALPFSYNDKTNENMSFHEGRTHVEVVFRF
jgi:hypothetical protein